MRLIKLLIGLLFLTTIANALSDSCVTIDENINSICVCVDNLDNCGIVNQTICMDGRDDHFIYFIPCNDIPDPSNYSGVLEYSMNTSLTTIEQFYVFIFMLIFCVGIVYAIKKTAID